MDRETELETELETEFNSICIFSDPGASSPSRTPPPPPATKHEIPKSFPRKTPKLKSVSPSRRAGRSSRPHTSIPFDRLVSPSGRASWSLSVLAFGRRRSRWSPFSPSVVLPVSPSLSVSPSRRAGPIVSSPHVHPVRSSRLSVRSCELVSLGCSFSAVRSRWSPFLRLVVLPGLAVSLVSPSRRAGLLHRRYLSLSLGLSIRIRVLLEVGTAAHHKDQYGDNGRWDDALPEDLVRAAYDKLASTRYTALMHKLKKNRDISYIYTLVHYAWSALTDSSETPPSVNDLYLHLHTVNHDRTTFIDTRSERFYDRLQSRRQELTQATPEQSVDDEAVYLNVAGECSKGRVYGLGSVGRKKRRYGTPGASTSQTPDVVPRAEFNVVAEQLRKVMNFMYQRLGMDMDEIGLAQQQPPPPPPPPPPHDQQQPPQIDPADPPQQGDNVGRLQCLGGRRGGYSGAVSLVGVMEALGPVA
ncbi:hypothetical protein Sjap_010335 [Stephania japonica]|uniref:Uncharacterized protein n=1 Tax=Stephania japonica TaxID=461633 RepID=A0AAP0P438_9MAGN